eukprot:g16245.t1
MRDNTGGPRGQLAAHPGAAQFVIDNAANDLRRDGINAVDQLLQLDPIKDFLEPWQPWAQPTRPGAARREFQVSVAERILVAQYFGALQHAARSVDEKRPRRTVYLMPLGGGVFNNPWESIANSIRCSSLKDWSFVNSDGPSIFDYACLSKIYQCGDLMQLRPDVASVRAIARDGCDELRPARGPSTRTPTTTRASSAVDPIKGEVADAWWPEEWGIVVWLGIAIVSGFLLLGCCYLAHRWRRRLQPLVEAILQP